MSKLVWSVSIDQAGKQVNAALASLKKSDQMICIAARSSIAFMFYNSDSRAMLNLLEGIRGTGVNVAAMRVWVEKHAGVKVSLDKESGKIKITFPENYTNLPKAEAVAKAAALPDFYAHVDENAAFKGFNLQAEIAKLVARAEAMALAKEKREMKRKGQVIKLSQVDLDSIDVTGLHEIKMRLEGRRTVEPEITLN